MLSFTIFGFHSALPSMHHSTLCAELGISVNKYSKTAATNSSMWTSQHRGEGGTKLLKAPKKENKHLLETCTLFIAPMRLIKHFQPESRMTIPIKMHLWTLQRTQQDERKVKERKNWLWQLLLQRNTVQTTHTVLLLWYHSVLKYVPQLPEGFTTGNYTTHQGVAAKDHQEKTQEEFRTYDLVDVNGSLWYGVPIFTFWRE